MATQSKVTAQGQISVPAVVRRSLGIGPGSVLEWEARDGAFLVRRAGRNTSTGIHAALFGSDGGRKPQSVDVKQALRKHARLRRARG